MKFRRRDNLKRHQAVHEAKHYVRIENEDIIRIDVICTLSSV